MKQKIISLDMKDPHFIECVENAIEEYPDIEIINFKDSNNRNRTFLHTLPYTEFSKYVAYFLEKGANIYVLDKEKSNPLHCSVGRAVSCIIDDQHKSTVPNSYQIFRLLLNYEAEQRAYFPEKYQDLPWLIEQPDDIKHTPIIKAEKFDKSPGKEVVEELKKALKEQEVYYQECLEAKAKNIPLMPYHRKFLPEIIKSTSIAEEKQEKTWKDKTWSEKILEGQNSSLRHRSKSDEPLQTKQEAAMKSISRSMEVEKSEGEKAPLLDHNGRDEEGFVSMLKRLFISNTGSDKVKGL
ncbi:hypothetical protein NOVO_06780 [Rickettsiales bacterium Ac37b]|nr:hypothetical protein NOVO_06780 [Rickettsiales bacterium Ac37b]